MIDQKEKKFIDTLAAQEDTLSQLYAIFSIQFPNNKFWKDLSIDESIHKNWVLSLYQGDDVVSIDQSHFKIEALLSSIEYYQKLIKESKSLTLVQALASALDIERSLIEKDFLNVFNGDSASVKRILSQLKIATQEHIKEVEIELNTVRNSLGL